MVAKPYMWCHHLFVGQIPECLLVTGSLLDVEDIDVNKLTCKMYAVASSVTLGK